MRRTSLALVLALFALPASASGECAWVLWVHETNTYIVEKTARISKTWELVGASSSEAGCRDKLENQIAKAEWRRTSVQRKRESMYYEVIDGHIVAVGWYREPRSPDDLPLRVRNLSYVCFPDTVEPRGPKEK